MVIYQVDEFLIISDLIEESLSGDAGKWLQIILVIDASIVSKIRYSYYYK